MASLRLTLREAGLASRELAAWLGVDQRTVRRWEAGEVPPGLHRAVLRVLLEQVDEWGAYRVVRVLQRVSLPALLADGLAEHVR